MTDTLTLPIDVARKIGAAPPLSGEKEPLPTTRLGFALYWVKKRGIYVFPVSFFLGQPLTDKSWFKEATTDTDTLIKWWTQHPRADIAAVPAKTGHFVLVTCGEEGRESLYDLEADHGGSLNPDFSYTTCWGEHHLWFKGEAIESHDHLAPGLHVVSHSYVYLPPSVARDFYAPAP